MEKKENKPTPFSFKQTNKKLVSQALKKMKKKMSAGIDGLSQHWNHAPNELKECATVWSAKKAIKQFSLTLPI